MKRFAFLLAASLFISTVGLAQSKDEKDVNAAFETLKKAMLDGNRGQLEAIAAPELTYGHSSGKMEDKAAFVETLASGKSDFLTFDATELSVKVVGNTAMLRHKLSAQTNDNGTPGSVNLGVLLVFQKQNGSWKLLARQAYKL